MTLEEKNKKGICPDQLLDKIVRLADELGAQPTQRQFAKTYGGGVLAAVKRTYGTWNNSLALAGLERRNPGPFKSYSKQDIIDSMHHFHKNWGRYPSFADFKDRNGLPSHTLLYKYFGSFNAAIQEAFNNYDRSERN